MKIKRSRRMSDLLKTLICFAVGIVLGLVVAIALKFVVSNLKDTKEEEPKLPEIVKTEEEPVAQEDSIEEIEKQDDSPVSQELADVEEANKEVSGDSEEGAYKDSREKNGLSESDVSGIMLEQSGNYYFELLNSEEKLTYVEIYQIMTYMGEDVLLTTKDYDRLEYIYQCVINDHPELFYLSGYVYTKHTINDEIKYITLSGKYMYDKAEVERRRAKLDSVVTEIMRNLPAGLEEFDTFKAVYDYIILHTDYSYESPDNQNICSVFLEHKSVCNGYAKAAQYLLSQYGIECLFVSGDAGGPHAWNIVKVNDSYYEMDVTWGDPSFMENVQNGQLDIDYTFLLLTSDELHRTHTPKENYKLPACTRLDDNYFVRNDLWLNEFSEDGIARIFARANEEHSNIVRLKFANEAAYKQGFNYLFVDKDSNGNTNVFNVFDVPLNNGKSSISYSQNDDLYTLTVWY